MTYEQGATTSRLPDPGAGFVWEAVASPTRNVPLLRPQTNRALAAFTTRRGGVSSDDFAELNVSFAVGDEEDRVLANRMIAGDTAVMADHQWSVVKQVHAAEIVPAAAASARRQADGMWTDAARRTLAVLSADCVLVLLVGSQRIGVAHAGWRGIVAGVIENAIAAVQPDVMFAGPAIGPCCFEVGPEVVSAFEGRAGASVVDARHVDLWTAVAGAAERAGVPLETARLCTSCHADLFFSHRRDRGRTGRQALLARMPIDA